MATIICDDCTESEVWTKIGTAVDGDTVVLPAGTGRWTSQHILNKAIKLEGNGIDSTILINDFSGAYWIRFDLPSNKLTEVTGITFKNGLSNGAGSIESNGALRFIGDNTSSYQLRVHHCKFEELKQWPVFIQQVRGVFDHNEWIRTDGSGAYIYGLLWKPDEDTTSDWGDGSWAYPTNAGGDDAIYFENNLFDQSGSSALDGVTTNGSPTVTSATANFNSSDLKKLITGTNIPATTYVGIINSATSIGLSSSPTTNVPRNATGSGTGIALSFRHPDKTFFDGTRGGRAVVRYNTLLQVSPNNAAIVTCHGLENRNRSIRHFEFYNNHCTFSTTTNKLINQRGGTVVAFNNRVVNGASTVFSPFQSDREGDPTNWGRASGSSPCDVNDPNGGTNSAPVPFETGRAMVTGTTTDHIVVSGTPWTGIDWRGYSVSDLSITWTAGVMCQEIPQYVGSVILSNTSNTIDTAPSTFGNPHSFASGHTFKIQRCLHAMDAVGRAGPSIDTLVTGGGSAGNPPIFPAGWNNQETEPLYGWNNLKTPSGSSIDFQSDSHPLIRDGEHYINNMIMPGYPWTDDVPTTCGAEDYTNIALTGLETRGGKGGFTYPHPLVEAPAGVAVIDVPSSRNFGNVIIGETGTYDIPVQNLGDTTLNVSGITLPTGYVIASSHSFTVSAGATVTKNVVFTPVAETTYAGNIVFASDTTGGNGTMAVTGAGVPPAGGGGHGHGKKKGVITRRA